MSEILRVNWGECGRVALLRANSSLVEHAHPQGHLIFWFAGARTKMRVSDNTIPLDQDHCALVNSFEPHEFSRLDSNDPVTFLLFYLEMPWLAHECLRLGFDPNFTANSIEIDDGLRALYQEFSAQLLSLPDEQLDLDKQVARFLHGVLEKAGARSVQQTPVFPTGEFVDFRLKRAIAYMRSHLNDRPNLNEVARDAGISRPHFFALFRKYMKVTPNLYWNTLRVEAAIDRLLGSDVSLNDLAVELGFTEPGNFSRFFRNHTGVAPSAYRVVAKPDGKYTERCPHRGRRST